MNLSDEFAARGCIAAVPDLFWRSLPGPLPRDDPRAAERSQPRLEKVSGWRSRAWQTRCDYVRALPRCNGRAAVIGFCYGGPYAILGPKRLGYDAGIACHGTQMLDFIKERSRAWQQPVCIIWGDQDHVAPSSCATKPIVPCRARMKNVEVACVSGVQHGYMMRGNRQSIQPADPRFFDVARSGDARRFARHRPSASEKLTPRGRKRPSSALRSLVAHDLLLLFAEPVDAEPHDVAGLQEALRLHAHADARWRAGGDDVARQ